MNGYQITADGYKRYIKEHPEEPEETKAAIQIKVEALEILAEATPEIRRELFNAGAFNDIVKGYITLAIEEAKTIPDGSREKIKEDLMRQLSYMFDTVTAAQAEQKYREG